MYVSGGIKVNYDLLSILNYPAVNAASMLIQPCGNEVFTVWAETHVKTGNETVQ